jgi:ABC-type uncharacterized transport system substrate-binding protein
MRRREFMGLLGAGAAWPRSALASEASGQRGDSKLQQPAMPVIAFISASSPANRAHLVSAFRQGVRESGYVEGQNVTIEYHWAQDQYDRLPDLVADLVRHQVAVIAATDAPSALAAKAASTAKPIVFASGMDPIKAGLVASLNRPGSNVTGISFLANELGTKQLGLLHDLQPRAERFAVLVDPNWPFTETFVSEVRTAASAINKPIEVLSVSTGPDINTAFASLARKPVDALLVGPSALVNNRRVQLVTLAAYHRMPAIYPLREYAEAGGLMSYGTSITDAHRLLGVYAVRILKGEKPADLPVMQATKFEFVVNLNTANAFGLTFPPGLLAAADEVIE